MEFWPAVVFPIKLPHKPEILGGEAVSPGKLVLEIPRKGFHHCFPPPKDFLLPVDGLADVPVKRDQLLIDRSSYE